MIGVIIMSIPYIIKQFTLHLNRKIYVCHFIIGIIFYAISVITIIIYLIYKGTRSFEEFVCDFVIGTSDVKEGFFVNINELPQDIEEITSLFYFIFPILILIICFVNCCLHCCKCKEKCSCYLFCKKRKEKQKKNKKEKKEEKKNNEKYQIELPIQQQFISISQQPQLPDISIEDFDSEENSNENNNEDSIEIVSYFDLSDSISSSSSSSKKSTSSYNLSNYSSSQEEFDD